MRRHEHRTGDGLRQLRPATRRREPGRYPDQRRPRDPSAPALSHARTARASLAPGWSAPWASPGHRGGVQSQPWPPPPNGCADASGAAPSISAQRGMTPPAPGQTPRRVSGAGGTSGAVRAGHAPPVAGMTMSSSHTTRRAGSDSLQRVLRGVLVAAGPGQSRRSTPKNEPPAARRGYQTLNRKRRVRIDLPRQRPR
jgi:hypothetical protein